MPQNYCPFDLLVAGRLKIEVKVSETMRKPKSEGAGWFFNIHRHGVVSSVPIDFYILCIPNFKNFGFKTGIYLVIPGRKIGKRLTVSVSVRSLFNQFSKYINKWKPLEDAARQ